MSEEKKIPTGDGNDNDQTPNPTDIYADLRGKKDAQGIPMHPEEKADYYREKFAESTRGAQDLLNKNKILSEENESLKTKSNTTQDLSNLIPEWETLSAVQQRAIIDSVGSVRQELESIKAQVAEIVDEREFSKGFKKVTSMPEFEVIKKHKNAFKDYAYNPDNLNVPLQILAKSFLVDKGLIGQQPPKDDPNPDAGFKGMDNGAGGDRRPTQKGGYTADEIEKIRKEDPRKYNRLAREGKLNIKE